MAAAQREGKTSASLTRVGLISLGLALGLVFGLAATEVGLRVMAGLGDAGGLVHPATDLRGLHRFRPDQPWLYELRPHAEGRISETGTTFYRINADGQRDSLYARPKPEGVFRIVVLGDSVSFGYGVEEADAYPQVLERLLAELVSDARIEGLRRHAQPVVRGDGARVRR